MRFHLTTLAALTTLGVLAPVASAQLGILAGGPSSAIYASEPGAASFQVVSACTGQIDSMIGWKGYLLAGTLDGSVYRFQLAGLSPVNLVGSFDLPGDAACLAMDGDTLLVGDSTTNTVRRVNPLTGQVLASFTLPKTFPPSLHAMLVHNGSLYVGGHTSAVYKGNPDGTGMAFLTLCGGAVDSMAVTDGALFLGTTSGKLYRINPTTGSYENVFNFADAQTALLADSDGSLLASSSTGIVSRINPKSGKVVMTFATTNDDLRALSSHEGNVFCSADADNDGELSINDFITFQTLFALGDASADFDQSGEFTVDDFIAFQSAFALGCPA
jgi:outer membrane protein assembly factor BamB